MQLPPFQEWFVQIIGMLGNIALAVATLWAASAAVKALATWRKEMRGKAQFELARKLVYLAHQYQEEFYKAQLLPPDQSEWASRYHQTDENAMPALTSTRNEYFARLQRLTGLRESLTRLKEAGWDATLIIGPHEASLAEPFEKVWDEYRKAIALVNTEQELRAKGDGIRFTMLTDEQYISYLRTAQGVPPEIASSTLDAAVKELERRLMKYTIEPVEYDEKAHD